MKSNINFKVVQCLLYKLNKYIYSTILKNDSDTIFLALINLKISNVIL